MGRRVKWAFQAKRSISSAGCHGGCSSPRGVPKAIRSLLRTLAHTGTPTAVVSFGVMGAEVGRSVVGSLVEPGRVQMS